MTILRRQSFLYSGTIRKASRGQIVRCWKYIGRRNGAKNTLRGRKESPEFPGAILEGTGMIKMEPCRPTLHTLP